MVYTIGHSRKSENGLKHQIVGKIIEQFDDWLAGQKDNLLLWFPLFLGLGSATYFGLKSEPLAVVIGLLWLISFLGFILALYFRHSIKFTWLFGVLAIFMIVTGFSLAKLRTEIVSTPFLLKETRPVMVEGDVSHVEKLEGRKGTLIILDNVEIENWKPENTPRRLRLTSKLRVTFNLGDRVNMLAKLTPPSMPVMPGAFDFRRHYFFDGIGAMGFVLKPPQLIKSTELNGAGLFLERLRKTMSDHIKSVLPARLSGIVTALVTGERAAIEDEDWDALRTSGLAHVISISGLHVVLMAAPVFFCTRFLLALIPGLALRWPIKKIAALIALVACCLYVGLVVPTVPTYRALLMTGIGLIAIMIDRSPFSLRLISFAAKLVLIFSPESIWSASFQLSFAAVLSLILFAEWTREYWIKWNAGPGRTRKFLLYLAGSVFTTLGVSIATAPLAAYHFQQIPVYSVVANALLIPLSAFVIMPGTIFTFLMWPVGFQDIPLKFMAFGVEWMLAIAKGTSEWPGAAWRLSAWSFLSIICFVFSGLCLYLLQGHARWLAAFLTIAGIILIVLAASPSILISQSGKLWMVKDKDDIYLSTARSDRFFAENWLKRIGRAENSAIILPEEGQVKLSDGAITCGSGMCRLVKGSHRLTFGNDYYALKQDCKWADIIVTSTAFRDKNCTSQIHNKFTLGDTGTIEIKENGRIETVAESLGIRPWSPRRRFNDTYVSDLIARPVSEHGQPSGRGAYKRRFQAQE